MGRLVEILNTMELLENYFESRMAEGNDLTIEESSCQAGVEYRELAQEAAAIMEAMEATQEVETQEVQEVEATETFVNNFFNLTSNKELDKLIDMAILSNKPLDQMSDEEYRMHQLNNAMTHLKNFEKRLAQGNKTKFVANMVAKYQKEVEKWRV